MKRKLPKASPALAKSVWQSQKRPSARNVARALVAAGYPVEWCTGQGRSGFKGGL